MTPRLMVTPPAALVPGSRREDADPADGPVEGDRSPPTDGAPWLALPAGSARLLTTPSTSPDEREALVAWLSGRRGPWRPRAVRLEGRALGHRRTAARVRAGLVTIAPPALAAEVSVIDHLAVRASRDQAERLLAEMPKLAGRGGDPAGVLSGGERQMVAWARAALDRPRVVLLDRAATGLDIEALAWVEGTLRRWRTAGCVALVCAGRTEEAGWTFTTRPDGRAPGPHG